MKDLNLVVCGCGALGSRIAYEIAYLPWRSITLIDDDIIEENNIPTSAYQMVDVGKSKVHALAEMIYPRYDNAEISIFTEDITLDASINEFLGVDPGDYLILDCFDNPVARLWTKQGVANPRSRDGIEALHIGVAAELSGAVIWDEKYTVPDGPPRGENPICTRDLGVDIIQKTAALAISVIHHYVATGEKVSAVISGFGIQVI